MRTQHMAQGTVDMNGGGAREEKKDSDERSPASEASGADEPERTDSGAGDDQRHLQTTFARVKLE